jgi:predicted metal-dependent hydrolase
MQIHQIIRSKRKTVAIIVNPEGQVIIRAPLRFPKNEIDQIVEKNIEWIQKKLEEMHARQKKDVHRYHEGERFLFIGKSYPLCITPDSTLPLTFTQAKFVLGGDLQNNAETQFERWYRDEARRMFALKVDKYCELLGVEVKKIRISGAKTRWGSCSSRRTISLSWRLLMAPEEVINYVVLHEVAHLVVMNHSKTFWELVQRWMPEYKARKKWLKEKGGTLRL